MAARMLEARGSLEGSFSARSDAEEFNPKQIALALAMKTLSKNEDLMGAPSRFAMKPTPSDKPQD